MTKPTTNIVAKINKFLSSKSLAVYIMVFLTIVTIIGMLIPQQNFDDLAFKNWVASNPILASVVIPLGLTDLYHAWWFIILAFLFLLNLSFCTLKHTKIAYRLWKSFEIEIYEQENDTKYCANNRYYTKESIFEWSRGEQLNSVEEACQVMVYKHKWGVWASVIFHLGLILIVLGGLCTVFLKMNGYMRIGEGETRIESHSTYSHLEEGFIFKEFDKHTNYEFTQGKLERFYQENKQKYVKSTLTVTKDGKVIKEGLIERGTPLSLGSMRLFYYDSGYAPGLIIKDSAGQVVHGSYVLFLTTRSDEGTFKYHLDEYQVPNSDIIVNIELFPNFVERNGTIMSAGDKPINPKFFVKATLKGQVLYSDHIGLDQTISVGGYTLLLTQLSNWTGYEIVRDVGAPVLFLGFWVALIGSSMLYFTNPCRVVFVKDFSTESWFLRSYFIKNGKYLMQELPSFMTKN